MKRIKKQKQNSTCWDSLLRALFWPMVAVLSLMAADMFGVAAHTSMEHSVAIVAFQRSHYMRGSPPASPYRREFLSWFHVVRLIWKKRKINEKNERHSSRWDVRHTGRLHHSHPKQYDRAYRGCSNSWSCSFIQWRNRQGVPGWPSNRTGLTRIEEG